MVNHDGGVEQQSPSSLVVVVVVVPTPPKTREARVYAFAGEQEEAVTRSVGAVPATRAAASPGRRLGECEECSDRWRGHRT